MRHTSDVMAKNSLFDRLEEMLTSAGTANNGADHFSDYGLWKLPNSDTLDLALGNYFSSLSTSNSPPQSADDWAIHIAPFPGGIEDLAGSIRHWFFGLEFSPRVESSVAEETVLEFLMLLEAVTGEARIHEVHVSPPMWYDCLWQDFAFDDDTERWLLHLGFSD